MERQNMLTDWKAIIAKVTFLPRMKQKSIMISKKITEVLYKCTS